MGSQAANVFLSLCLGVILCAFYDIIRATRKAGADSFAAVFIGDIFFWLVSAFAVFLFLIATTNGEIRGYVLFFAAVGFILYRLTLGRAVFYLLQSFFIFLARVLRKTMFLSAKFCGITEKQLSRFIKAVLSRVKKLLKSIYNMVYTKTDKKVTGNDLSEQGE